MSGIRFCQIPFSSLFYDELLQLRQTVLRTPLGRVLEFEQVRTDHHDRHLGAVQAEKLIAVITLTPQTPDTLRMRQMAIAPDHQAQGIGRRLLQWAEQEAFTPACSFIVLDARESALGFYKKLGYTVVGEPFVKSGIPHRYMRKAAAE